jgi:hypothetical protein
MQINKLGLKIYVCANVVLEHFSEGLYSPEFLEGLKTFTTKWRNNLPYHVQGAQMTEYEKQECRGIEGLKRRIESDRLVRLINENQRKAQGNAAISLPVDAEQLIEDSFYRYAKAKIKFAKTNKEARQALRVYLNKGFKKHSKSLIRKYVYYRFIHCKKNQVIPVDSLNPQANNI